MQQPHQFPRASNDGSVQQKEANNDFELLIHAEMLANQVVQPCAQICCDLEGLTSGSGHVNPRCGARFFGQLERWTFL